MSMELLHRRLGHTAQSGMERLMREQMVRGLEEGIKGDSMFRGCAGDARWESQVKESTLGRTQSTELPNNWSWCTLKYYGHSNPWL